MSKALLKETPEVRAGIDAGKATARTWNELDPPSEIPGQAAKEIAESAIEAYHRGLFARMGLILFGKTPKPNTRYLLVPSWFFYWNLMMLCFSIGAVCFVAAFLASE